MIKKLQLKERYDHFIGGEWVAPNNQEYFDNYNPSTGEKLTKFARGNQVDVDLAVQNAEAGFKDWYNLKPYKRGQILLNFAQLLRKNVEDLAHLETLDTGKPLNASRGGVEMAARFLEYMGGYADKIFGEVIPTGGEQLAYTMREPYGVVANIIPWNSPITAVAKGIAPALTAGNSIVFKASELASIVPLEVANLAIEAGVPPGVINVLTGFGDEAGSDLVDHTGIRKIGFTGSVETGQSIMKGAAERIVPVTLELGGKSPNIVFEDADIQEAALGSLKAFIANTGQVCSSGTRLFVHSSIKDLFIEKLVEETKKVKIDNGLENPTIGPVISEGQLDRILYYLEKGQKEGAKIAYGGQKINKGNLKDGYFIEPTIFTNVTNSMTIAQEEIFGPVLSVISFDTEEEVIKLANDTTFGLAAGIWSESVKRTHRVAQKLLAGNVYINDYPSLNVEVPFGGYKQSGIGRDRGLESVMSYTQLKSVLVKM